MAVDETFALGVVDRAQGVGGQVGHGDQLTSGAVFVVAHGAVVGSAVPELAPTMARP